MASLFFLSFESTNEVSLEAEKRVLKWSRLRHSMFIDRDEIVPFCAILNNCVLHICRIHFVINAQLMANRIQ